MKLKMEMICLSRKNLGRPMGVIKYDLFRKTGKMTCQDCGKECADIGEAEMDHIIPVGVGGSLINEDNLQILCNKCHGIKSGKDRKIINQLKKEGILESGFAGVYYCESISDVIEIYKNRYIS